MSQKSQIPEGYNVSPSPHRDEYLRRANSGPPDDACRIHIAIVQPTGPNYGEEMVRRVQKLVLAQREADAVLVEAAGCRCVDLEQNRDAEWVLVLDGHLVVSCHEEGCVAHDAACPIALGAKIRGGA